MIKFDWPSSDRKISWAPPPRVIQLTLSLIREEINDVEYMVMDKTREPGNYLTVRKFLTVIRDLLFLTVKRNTQTTDLGYLQFIYRLTNNMTTIESE